MTITDEGQITLPLPVGTLSGGLVWTVEDVEAVKAHHAQIKGEGSTDVEIWESTRAGKTTVSCSYRRDGVYVTVRAEAS
jgi:hypothetical protein